MESLADQMSSGRALQTAGTQYENKRLANLLRTSGQLWVPATVDDRRLAWSMDLWIIIQTRT